MTIFKTSSKSWINLLVLFSVLLVTIPNNFGCEKKKPVAKETPWPQIVKDLKVIQDLRIADSTKIRYIEQTFQRYGISAAQYQEFVQQMEKKSATADIRFLKTVERLLLKEMKAEAKKQVPKVPGEPLPRK